MGVSQTSVPEFQSYARYNTGTQQWTFEQIFTFSHSFWEDDAAPEALPHSEGRIQGKDSRAV